jgi:hypothetical protein
MTDSRETGSQPAPEPQAGRKHGERARRSQPAFGQEEAEAVADAQEEAVEQGLLPPSRDEAGPGSN